MKNCLNCNKEYEPKRASSKFCSTSCRVRWYQRNSKGQHTITPMKMHELYDAVMQAVNGINFKNGQPPAMGAIIIPDKRKEAVLGYNELRELIESATSSMQLHAAWKQVEKNKELPSWQIKILTQLKEDQRTKIDF